MVFAVLFCFFTTNVLEAQTLLRKELKTETDGFQWYEYHYDKNSNGKWPTAAFDLNGKPLTCTTEYLIRYRGGYFDVWTNNDNKGDHVYAYYSSQGNCIASNCWGTAYKFKENNCLEFKKRDGFYGLYDLENDKQVLAPRYEEIGNLEGTNCWRIKENGKYGLYDLKTDKQMLPVRYDWIDKKGEGDDYCEIRENGKCGLYDLKNERQVINPQFYAIREIVEGVNGERFVKVSADVINADGFYDISGEEILAPEFQSCAYLGSNLFKFKMNGYWGVMNRQGKIIIPLSRQYTQIDYSRTLNTFTFVKEGGYKGECNAKGVQTSIVKMQTQKPQQEAKQPTTPKQTTSTPASSGITSSSNTTSSSKKEDGLLYEGDYTEGPWTNPNTGYSQPAPMPNHHIKIYEDHIIIDMVSLPYQGKSMNGEKMYVNSWSNITYYVDGFYNIRSTFPYGYSQFSKGNVVYDMNAPVQGGYDNNNNNSYGTTPQKHEHGTREVTETCPVCHSTGNCQTCLGRGWRTLTDNSTQQCPTCKGNKVCWKCNGTGKITKTERY